MCTLHNFLSFTLVPLYKTVHYKMVLDIRQFKVGQTSVVAKQNV